MTPERWLRIDEVFAGTAGLAGDALRLYLEQQCDGDPDLRREVDALLAHDSKDNELLEGVVGQAAELLSVSRSEIRHELAERRIGTRIGPYLLLRVLGTGGMGVVYLAVRDEDGIQQKVAIKLIQSGFDSKFVLSRFRQERRILSQLEHPSIARFIDGGVTSEGQPYYVMEFVEDGKPITDYCRAHRLPLERRLHLFLEVCMAVNQAHRNLVVHRDLKPGNILVGKNGNVKLLDFGIAKVLDDSAVSGGSKTQTVVRMLTPDYASPEQVTGDPITTATDVYSLGAILYELLTGQMAHRFRNYSNTEIERVVCRQDPERMSHVLTKVGPSPEIVHSPAALASDLDSIVAMALRKERQSRYGTVEQLADDIQRFLAGEPVLAHSGTVTYRAGKFIRRNRLSILAAAAISFSLIGGIAATYYQARRAERRFQQVRSLSSTLLTEFDTRAASLPQSTELREWLTSTVVRYLDNLAQDAGDDRSLQLDLANGYSKVAQLQSSATVASLGQDARALTNYRKAAAIYDSLLKDHPQDLRIMEGLCATLQQVATADSYGGNVGMSRAEYLRAANLGAELARVAPVPGNQCLARVYSGLVSVELRSSNPSGAMTFLAHSLEAGRRLDELAPSRDAKELLIQTHLDMGWALMESGKPDAAMESVEQARRLGEALQPAQQWQDSRLRFRMLDLAGDISGNPRDITLQKPDHALSFYLQALRIVEGEYAQDRNDARARRDLDRLLRKVALMTVDSRAAEAAGLVERALALSDINLRASPNNTEYIRDHVDGLLIRAYALQNQQRHRDALTFLQQALQRQLQLQRSSPESKRFQRELQETYEALGDSYLALGDEKRALEHYEKGRERTVALLWERPTDAYLQRDLSDSDEKLANIYAAMARKGGINARDRWRQVLDYQAKSVEIWAQWPRRIAPSAFQRTRLERATKFLDSYQRTAGRL